jgi:phenylpropionate dioxygenase-like ring-hydroxylating dioxygenase large terminal subunit
VTMEFDVVAEGIGAGYTLPASWYADEEIFRVEQKRIFQRYWQYVGRADQVAGPGDYFAARAGTVPIAVVRDRAGDLRAFVNVCRHRAHEVVQGEGNRATLQCPYHAWTYSLDGTLRTAPRADREPGFDKEELSLLPVQVAAWGPFVFANVDADAAPLAEALGVLPELVAQSGVDVDALRFRERSSSELAANWKVVVENFLECYHCAVAHPSFSSVVDVDPDAYRLEIDGLVSSQFGPVRRAAVGNGKKIAYDPRGEAEEGHFHFLFPNFALNIMPGRANVSVGPVIAAGPERTLRFLDYFFAADVPDDLIGDMLEFDAQVGREDRGLIESVQRGLRSEMVERGRLMPESEKLIAHFQRLVHDALAGEAQPG